MSNEKPAPLGAQRLVLPAPQRLRHRHMAWISRLAGDLWYPHWPLSAVLMVLAGYALSRSFPTIRWDELAGHLGMVMAFLQSLLAVALLVSAVGMLFRMRVAWISALLSAAGSLALRFLAHSVALPLIWVIFDGLVFVALLRMGRHFAHKSAASATLFAAVSLALLLSYATVGALFLGTGFSPSIHHLLTALYFSVVTLSTVGYGDIVPKTPEARLFTISVIFLGITVFATAISSILVPMLGQHLHELLGKKRLDWPKNHIVIAGGGDLARNTYHALRAKQYEVMLVGRDWRPEVAEEAEIHPLHYVTGDHTRRITLEKAFIRNAHAILCLDPSDELNAFTLLAARQIRPDIRSVVLINEVRHAPTLLGLRPDLALELDAALATWVVQELLGEPLHDPLGRLLFFLEGEPTGSRV